MAWTSGQVRKQIALHSSRGRLQLGGPAPSCEPQAPVIHHRSPAGSHATLDVNHRPRQTRSSSSRVPRHLKDLTSMRPRADFPVESTDRRRTPTAEIIRPMGRNNETGRPEESSTTPGPHWASCPPAAPRASTTKHQPRPTTLTTLTTHHHGRKSLHVGRDAIKYDPYHEIDHTNPKLEPLPYQSLLKLCAKYAPALKASVEHLYSLLMIHRLQYHSPPA